MLPSLILTFPTCAPNLPDLANRSSLSIRGRTDGYWLDAGETERAAECRLKKESGRRSRLDRESSTSCARSPTR